MEVYIAHNEAHFQFTDYHSDEKMLFQQVASFHLTAEKYYDRGIRSHLNFAHCHTKSQTACCEMDACVDQLYIYKSQKSFLNENKCM